MPSGSLSRTLAVLGALACGFAAPRFSAQSVSPSMRALIVGGGPSPKYNQAAIESNVRYVYRLLPSGSAAKVLFADGNPETEDVQWQDEYGAILYRKPRLPRLDGPSSLDAATSQFTSLATDLKLAPRTPTLLYFTGHGGEGEDDDFKDNSYSLWDDKTFAVNELASLLRLLPPSTPVTLVMVECFSGAFGDLIFQNGDPGAGLADLNLCGFFASLPWREAAGCTPEINEADYRDFTSYFFAALTRQNRLGQTVPGADYNHDGIVGMNEAFAYALINDDSIDTPVCTSDIFLRKFVKMADVTVFATPYSSVAAWATPAQRAALDALSKTLDFDGEKRLQSAFEAFLDVSQTSQNMRDVHLIRFIRLAKSVVLAHSLTTSSDRRLKARFAALIAREDGNPFLPRPERKPR